MTARRRGARVLPRPFYDRPTLAVAHDLLGKVLVHRTAAGVTAGMILETEAYIGESDPACHAAPGPTRRNQPLYGMPGHAYVYLNYGLHALVNVVTEPAGSPAAVLIRALEPLEGLDLMGRRRGPRRDGRERTDHELCRGPGNLTRAMGITLRQNRVDLTRGGAEDSSGTRASRSSRTDRLWIEDRDVRVDPVSWSPRVGITAGVDRLWRCFAVGHPCVSGRRARA